ncbi:iron(III) transport system ATP-binding protein [Hamadaea flava]|uniref:ABC transporter ATP-binding protein n=1 Tax=Hamadaea flava TaxID=1742688 RepID=A0ABV8LWP8_9ACTN|nr:ABC transporter ATP-binding protein [Hamadaea flava]MCP2328798.1 iron(III) transport system ATP-binding protein [Hamadaea flava]
MIPIRLDHVSKTYAAAPEAEPAISADLTIQAGEFFTLLGPSGCGKSTLLRMVAGFVAPTTGSIWFGDREVTRLAPHKRGIGMVFQNYALFPHMTVAENVAYGLKIRRAARESRDSQVAAALSMVGLDGMGSRGIDQLSGGQQQRVALARAVVIQPDLLLLDEPLSNLDAKLREETRTQIREVQETSGTTAVYVTHDQAEAMAISDRIAVLADGRAHQIDEPRRIYRQPATSFVARFIGRSNVLPVTVVAVGDGTADVSLAGGSRVITVPRSAAMKVAAGSTAELSVRPQALRLVAESEALLRGEVSRVEYLGATVTATVDVGGSTVVVSASDGQTAPEQGERVSLGVDETSTWLIPE